MQAVADSIELQVEIPRKLWTRAEAHALVDAGISGAEKLQLINGELIAPMKKRSHVLWQKRVHQWLNSAFGAERVEAETPNDVALEDNVRSEPEPDLKVLRQPSDEYSSNPQAEDILLIVEISDSTLRFDLNVKAKLYARAAIVEYWVLNIPEKRLVVHREPHGGLYTSVVAYGADDEVSPLSAPSALFCLNSL